MGTQPALPGDSKSDKPVDPQAELQSARPGEIVDLSDKFAALGISVFAFKKPKPRDN